MTDQIDFATASQLFDTQVTLQYQNSGKLKNTIAERHGTTGDATNIPVSDIVEMQQISFAPSDIPITPVDETNVTVVPYNFAIKTVIGGGQKTLFAYDKIVDHAKIHAKAAARYDDYIKINALVTDASYGGLYTVDKTVGINTGLNSDKIADALSYLEDQGVEVDEMQCSLWASALLKKSMFNDEKVVNFFYNTNKPLSNNKLSEYLDVDIRFLGSNGINTMPYTTSGGNDTYLIPLVHRDSMVQIYNRDVRTSMIWVGQNDRYEMLTVMTSGAKVVQSNGIALITCDNPFAANA